MLSKPFLAKCADRASTPKIHPTSGVPEKWFSNEILLPNKLFGTSCDFFVDWSTIPNSITPVIWIKRILEPKFSYADVIVNLANIITDEFGTDYLTRFVSFAKEYHFQVQLIIYRDDCNWSNPKSEILIVTLTIDNNEDIIFDYSIVLISELRTLIKSYSGGPVRIGSKGLIYGTSNLECYLSGTDSLYPGDVDLIIFDDKNTPKCILEFKKHTLRTPINNQKLSNYYPYPDGRKYNRLALLKDYLSRDGHKIPFFVLYYPTNATITEGRLELLKGDVGSLSTMSVSNFILPTDNSFDESNKVVTKLINTIEEYFNQK